MTFPDSTLAWFLLIVLSMVSSLFCWTGVRRRNVAHLLWGIGLGIPTFNLLSWKMWLGGAAVCALGAWMQSKLQAW